jgi:hypothetical protein
MEVSMQQALMQILGQKVVFAFWARQSWANTIHIVLPKSKPTITINSNLFNGG